jgi:hypothetical protein
MSTRTNILVTHGSTRIYLYRHCDGYPSETGADLAAKLNQCKRIDDFLAAILAERYEATSFRTGQPVYEITSEVHGDIEWAYAIDFDTGNGSALIGAAAADFGTDRDEAMSRAGLAKHSVTVFLARVVQPFADEVEKRAVQRAAKAAS